MNAEHHEWPNANSLRRYPLADDTDTELPNGFIADLSVTCGMDSDIRVMSAGSTGRVASIVISDNGIPVLAATFSAGSPVPSPMVPLVPGYSGIVTPGPASADAEIYRNLNVKVNPSCIHASGAGVVTSINRSGSASPAASGHVQLVGGDGVAISGQVSNGTPQLIVSLTPEKAQELVESVERSGCPGTPILSINGVRPDAEGRILIRFL